MKSKAKYFLALLVVLFLGITEAYSRAGGGGGHSGGGGSDDGGGGGGGFGLFFLLASWPGRIVLIIILIVVAYTRFASKKNSGGTDLVSGTSGGPVGQPDPIAPEFFTANPGFTTEGFSEKVKTAFLGIQDAWMNKNLGKVRKWISDGVYQRFNAQFTMMNALEQTNILSNINIRQIRVESTIQDGAYSIITASVYFSMDDNFICKKDPSFNERFTGDTATEYWTFIKKSGVAEKDLYNTNNCPNCGFALKNDAGQVSKCESCGTVTYLGDYDWVLCEIIQEDDYNAGNYRLTKDSEELQAIYTEKDSDFCIQLMEDKASNAVMQYFVSQTTQDLKYLNRFTDDALFAKLEQFIKEQGPFVYNRLFLNDVALVGMAQDNNMWVATIRIIFSSMRLQQTENGLTKMDDTVVPDTLIMKLGKKVGAVQKNKLWGFECASCGAPYADTTVTECSYCSAKINSPDNDWVMIDLTEEA